MAEIAPVVANVEDFDSTLKRVVQTANANALVAKGLHEVCKALETKDEAHKPKFVVLAANCTEEVYVKLVKALAKQNKIPLLEVPEGETLGDWLGHCKYDKNKNIRKKRKCSSLALKEYPAEIKENERSLIQAKLTTQ